MCRLLYYLSLHFCKEISFVHSNTQESKTEKILWHCVKETKDMRLPQRIHPVIHTGQMYFVLQTAMKSTLTDKKQFSAEHLRTACFQYWMGLAPWKDPHTKK
uniref:Uncharacterized protein n=1 Tax=Micrurus corallinus TaxID=54390 RepID=A0A2D4GF49_MICCO